MKDKTVPVPDRRKSIRRDEDTWKNRRTDVLENLLSDLAFEVRNMLVPVPGLMEELGEELGKMVDANTQERQGFKEQWSSGLNFVSDQVQRLIDRTKQVRLHTQPLQCPLQDLLEKVLQNWRSTAEKNEISIECQGLESLPTVLAYEWRLQELFFHPIARAINVTQPGGSVKVSGRVDQVQDFAIIEVTDNGPSVPPEVCDAFNKGDDLDLTEKEALKTWVMLDMPGLRKLALIHGCQVALESREGDGTTCSICIPLGNATEA